MKTFLVSLSLLTALSAPANDILVFLKTKTYATTYNLEQITPAKALAPSSKTSTSKSYQIIDVQGNTTTYIDFFGTTPATKFYVIYPGAQPFGIDLSTSTYVVIPQKLGTTLWCGGFDSSLGAMPGELNTLFWRGAGTPLKLSPSRTIPSVPRTLELQGIEAASYRSFDPVNMGPGNNTGFYSEVITGSIALQEPLTKNACLGIAAVVKENGDGAILTAGTEGYGVELVRLLLKSQGYNPYSGL